jgi:hypothetical protein
MEPKGYIILSTALFSIFITHAQKKVIPKVMLDIVHFLKYI